MSEANERPMSQDVLAHSRKRSRLLLVSVLLPVLFVGGCSIWLVRLAVVAVVEEARIKKELPEDFRRAEAELKVRRYDAAITRFQTILDRTGSSSFTSERERAQHGLKLAKARKIDEEAHPAAVAAARQGDTQKAFLHINASLEATRDLPEMKTERIRAMVLKGFLEAKSGAREDSIKTFESIAGTDWNAFPSDFGDPEIDDVLAVVRTNFEARKQAESEKLTEVERQFAVEAANYLAHVRLLDSGFLQLLNVVHNVERDKLDSAVDGLADGALSLREECDSAHQTLMGIQRVKSVAALADRVDSFHRLHDAAFERMQRGLRARDFKGDVKLALDELQRTTEIRLECERTINGFQ